MSNTTVKKENKWGTPYLSTAGAWALSFGCAVGWGSFVMPGSTFLPNAGPLGTAIGILIGAVIMIIIGANYHFLMNRFPDSGGAYTYSKKVFSYDHGFLNAWFMILTYIAIIWANATALPLIARALLGNTFQFGFLYEIAGYQVYIGEILLSAAALAIAAFLCMRRRLASRAQIIMAVLLFLGIIICFIAAKGSSPAIEPAYSPDAGTSINQIFTILALAPWAFVGFESVSNSAGEAKFSLKKSFGIFVIAIITSAAAYILLALLAATHLPEGCASWVDYIANLGNYQGLESMPTFHAADAALGSTGILILGIAALCAVFTGLIGNYVAISRLIISMSEDEMLPESIGKLNENHVPYRAIFIVFVISLILPFFGRTAISWIVDVTTVGATIIYAFTSAAAFKTARHEKHTAVEVTGIIGIIISLFFAVAFLIPNVLGVTTMSRESYLILAAWGILGFIFFHYLLQRDKNRRMGHSTVAWIIMLAIVIFAASIWMYQNATQGISDMLAENGIEASSLSEQVEAEVGGSSLIQIGILVVALAILFSIYAIAQKREKQIEIEKVLAEESSRAKTSFLSNMSHEIRTPMNAIIGLDNIALRNPDLQPKTREQLEKIGASAKHLLGLINDILDMSRIESGRMVLKNEEFSFREFLDQINIIINGQCVDKGLRYECRIASGVADYYFGDDMKLKQVLINILGNSVKFTEAPGDVTLTAEQTARFEGFCTLKFTMKDTGIGMDKEYIPKIFEAFSQEDATTTNKYGGSGLGMAITKNFVEMMNGEIHVDSEKGVGSTFTVTVTLRESSRSASAEIGEYIPKDLRAIVVDDDEIACEHVQDVLRSIGIEADSAVSPIEALELIKTAHDSGVGYDIVLTDYRMPEMNGLELIHGVHEFDGGKTAVILLTGYNYDIIEQEAAEEGVDCIMSKPIFSDNLAKQIHAIYMKRGSIAHDSGTMGDADSAVGAEEGTLAGLHVLMAEDVEQNAEILMDLLELEDITADRAENGQIAVEMFEKSEPGTYDAILMDVRMPVMDGLAATRAIRELGREDAKTIPVIAMTANVFDEDVENSLQAGMNAHLSKPVEPERLFATLAEYTRKNADIRQ